MEKPDGLQRLQTRKQCVQKGGRAPISSLLERGRLAWVSAGVWGHEKVLFCPLRALCFGFSPARPQALLRCFVASSFCRCSGLMVPLLAPTNHSDGNRNF